MSRFPLQYDRMLPIKLPEICAPRPELLKLFDKASEKHCIYVNAPGGCGKTVSTLLWIQKHHHIPIWLGLDEYDNTATAFYRFFSMALFTAIPQNESLTNIITEAAFNNSPVEYTIDILSRFSFDDRKYALVLDDFYFITNEEILKSLGFIIKRLPLSITVVFLSRSELPPSFESMNQAGKIAFITASELAFKSSEIRRFFSSYGRFISEKEAKQAYDLTDGWAIAVNALVLSGRIAANHKLDENILYDYIEKEIWNKFYNELKLFLIRTSVVDVFNLELCQRLSNCEEAEQMLDILCTDNMFISRSEDTFHYHHIFLQYLREKAEGATGVSYDLLYQIAADYYFDKEIYFDALRYYIKAENKKGIANALYRFWSSAGKSGSEFSKIAFICELPTTFLDKNPYLYVGCAWYSLFCNKVEQFFSYLDKIYDKIQEIVIEYPMFLEGMLFLFTIDYRYTFTQQRDRLLVGGALALDAYKVPKSYCQYFPTYHRTHRDYSYYALNTEEHFEDFCIIFQPMLGIYYPIIEKGVRAGLLYEKNQLKEALFLGEPSPTTDSDELLFLSKLHIASCLFAMGRELEASQCRAEIKSILDTKNLLYLYPIFSAYETNIKLLDGDKSIAKAWLDNYFVIENQEMELHRIYLHFTTARAYIVLGEYKKADQLCQGIKTLSNDYSRLMDGVEATVLLIILKWLTGKKQEAVELLMSTLAKTQPYSFIRVFADEGQALLPVLNRLKNKTGHEDTCLPNYKYIHTIYQAAYEVSKRHKGLAGTPNKSISLSRQQSTVLELLAKGYRNAEIVEITGLSINTIRSHTKIVYQKLEVHSSVDAVLRARELELIK